MILRLTRKKPPFDPTALAPDGLIDLHSHLLPMVDDGAGDWDDASAMVDGFGELGYVRVAATPHFDNREMTPGIEAQQHLIAKIDEKRSCSVPEIVTAAEIPFDDRFVAKETTGAFPQLGGWRTYLVEFSHTPGSIPSGIEKIAFQMRVRGVTLVLAHPERHSELVGRPELVAALRRSGVLFQLDIMSLVDRYGPAVRREALRLLERDQVDLVSSDLHSPAELPLLGRALEALARLDEVQFAHLASHNPKLILEGRASEVERVG